MERSPVLTSPKNWFQCLCTCLMHCFSVLSIGIWVRELKVPPPKAVWTFPHFYCAIQLETTCIQDKFCSNTGRVLPPSALLKHQNRTHTHSMIHDFLLATKHIPKVVCIWEIRDFIVMSRNHSNIFQRAYCSWSHIQLWHTKTPLTSLQRQKTHGRHYQRHLMSWPMFLT